MQEKPLTPLEIYRVLPQTNCQRCMLPTCLAFAAGVVAGRKKLRDCLLLGEREIARLSGSLHQRLRQHSLFAQGLSECLIQ